MGNKAFPRMHFLKKRPYMETANAKTDRRFQATLSLYEKKWFVALKQHWETRGNKKRTQIA